MTSPHDPLLTLVEAGELLGTGPGLPRRLIAEGHLDPVRDGRHLRIAQSALIAYLTVSAIEQGDSATTRGGDAA